MNNIIPAFLLPICTALICCLLVGLPSVGRRIFIACSAVLQLVVAVSLTVEAVEKGPLVLNMGSWGSSLGIVLVVDELAGVMLCMSAFVSLACILFGFAEIRVWAEQPLRLPLMQLLVAGINLTFITGDLFNLFVAFEIMLIASYALLTLEADSKDIREAFPYLAINIFGSTLFIVGAGLAYALFGTLNLAHISQQAAEMQGSLSLNLVVMLLMVVFGIKAGVFPLYYWLPNSYPILPASLGAIYSGLLTKVGIYVMLRMLCTVFPHTLTNLYMLLMWLAGWTMVLAVLGAVSREFIRGILSFQHVSQVGYMVLAIGFFTPLSLAACVYYIIHHIIVKSSLFMIGGTCSFYNHTDNLSKMGGIWKVSPLLGTCFLLQAFSIAGVPPLSGFWGKYLIMAVGVEEGHYWLVGAAVLASILTLFTMLKVWLSAFWRNVPEGGVVEKPNLALRSMTAVIVMMTITSLIIGFGAELFLDFAVQVVDSLLDQSRYQEAVFGVIGKEAGV